MSQRPLPPADTDPSRTPGLSRRALFTATAVGIPTAAAVVTAAPALADPTVTDGETRIVEVPLVEVPLLEVDGAPVRELADQSATMIGVTWPDGTQTPTVSARGLAEGQRWTEWSELEVAEDPETGASAAGTEVAWLGIVSALQIRAELDGGDVSAELTAHVVTTSPVAADEQVQQLSGPTATRTQSQQMATRAAAPSANPATPTLGPGMPAYVSRAAWRADESSVRGTSAKDALKAVVLHHTAGTNNYSSAQSAQIVRGILSYHTRTLGWADMGYNVLVDKYGQIFEGRSGGLHRNITGAHALGFNSGSFGISVMGNYSSASLPSAARTAVAKLVAWKLLSTFQTSVAGNASWNVTTSGTRHSVGSTVSLPRMMGHRDVNFTECPGKRIYDQFGTIRAEAQRHLDSGWKEHLWAFQGAGGASKLGTVVTSNHRTGKYSATILTKGLVLQESGNAHAYATPMAKQWQPAWGRPSSNASQDGDRQIQVFQNGTAALESGKVRFVTPSFRDVAPSRVFFLEIQDLFAQDVTRGWGGGSNRTFQPNSNNLRDAMIVFIYRALGEPKFTPPARSPFRDVDPSFVFYKELCWAYDKGIALGWGSGSNRTFRPLEPVKRDAVAAFLYRAANYPDTNQPSASASDADRFTDVLRTHVFAKEIGWLAKTGISRGWDDGTFRPDAYIKRDQMATFVMRWMKHTGRL